MKKFLLRRLGVADDPGQYRPSLVGCLEAVLEQSDTLVDEALEGLGGMAVALPGKNVAHTLSPEVRKAIEALVAQREVFQEQYAIALRAALYGGDAQRGVASAQVRFDDFQFLEEEQIDASIEFAMTQQEVNRAVDDALPALHAMMSTLLGWVTVQPHLNPLKPESFVYALRQVMRELVPDDSVRATVMTLAAGRMGVGLRQLYKELTEWLRSQGVEPASTTVQAVGAGATKPPDNTVTRTLLTLDKLRRLLTGEYSVNRAQPRDFMSTVPASFDALQDLKLLEPMMKRLTDRANQAALQGGTAAVGKGKGKPQASDEGVSGKLSSQLGEEVTRLMLENLMLDDRLLNPVRQCLKQLEPVLIQLSKSDPRFFSERQHPARQFLEKITHRSLAFTSESEAGFPRFLEMFDNAVQVLLQSSGDVPAFERVLRNLEDTWQRQEQVQRRQAEEAARNLLHIEQRNILAERLGTELSQHLDTKRIPEAVVQFVRGPWAQVIAEAQISLADGSTDPGGYQAVVDDLLWSVQPKLARRNRARLVDMVPGMLVKLRQGLRLIAYPEDRVTTLFDTLITQHEKAFDSSRILAVKLQDIAPPPPETVAPTAPVAEVSPPSEEAAADDGLWVAEDEASESIYLRNSEDLALDFTGQSNTVPYASHTSWSAQTLHTGSWVDLALGGAWVRAQLTWASPHRSLFMFISGSGMAHTMSRRTMERLRGLNLIRLVSDGRVMDNALDAVARAALQNDIEKAAGGG